MASGPVFLSSSVDANRRRLSLLKPSSEYGEGIRQAIRVQDKWSVHIVTHEMIARGLVRACARGRQELDCGHLCEISPDVYSQSGGASVFLHRGGGAMPGRPAPQIKARKHRRQHPPYVGKDCLSRSVACIIRV